LRYTKLRHGVPCRSFVLTLHSALALGPRARLALHFGIEDDVERLGWCRVEVAMFTDADFGEELLVGKATVLV